MRTHLFTNLCDVMGSSHKALLPGAKARGTVAAQFGKVLVCLSSEPNWPLFFFWSIVST